jgi:hypothetical protein
MKKPEFALKLRQAKIKVNKDMVDHLHMMLGTYDKNMDHIYHSILNQNYFND